jgi:alanine racemase
VSVDTARFAYDSVSLADAARAVAVEDIGVAWRQALRAIRTDAPDSAALVDWDTFREPETTKARRDLILERIVTSTECCARMANHAIDEKCPSDVRLRAEQAMARYGGAS